VLGSKEEKTIATPGIKVEAFLAVKNS